MNFTFSGGTSRQRELFVAATRALLHFDLDLIPVDVDVDFTADPAPGMHNEFAFTEGTTIAIRTDAPDFAGLDPDGQTWGMPFFNEVVAHEIAHVLLGLFPAERQEALAALFGSTVAGWDEGPWQERTLEGIAETFKDAFLPRSQRRYANRTNRKLPISQYKELRRLFREGFEATIGGGGEERVFLVPEPDGRDLWRDFPPGLLVDDSIPATVFHGAVNFMEFEVEAGQEMTFTLPYLTIADYFEIFHRFEYGPFSTVIEFFYDSVDDVWVREDTDWTTTPPGDFAATLGPETVTVVVTFPLTGTVTAYEELLVLGDDEETLEAAVAAMFGGEGGGETIVAPTQAGGVAESRRGDISGAQRRRGRPVSAGRI